MVVYHVCGSTCRRGCDGISDSMYTTRAARKSRTRKVTCREQRRVAARFWWCERAMLIIQRGNLTSLAAALRSSSNDVAHRVTDCPRRALAALCDSESTFVAPTRLAVLFSGEPSMMHAHDVVMDYSELMVLATRSFAHVQVLAYLEITKASEPATGSPTENDLALHPSADQVEAALRRWPVPYTLVLHNASSMTNLSTVHGLSKLWSPSCSASVLCRRLLRVPNTSNCRQWCKVQTPLCLNPRSDMVPRVLNPQ